MSDSLNVRVVQGIAYLDDFDPSWWKKVEPNDIDMNSAEFCVLGQVTGAHDVRQRIARAPWTWVLSQIYPDLPREEAYDMAEQHGFDVLEDESYYELDLTWQKAVRKRQRAEKRQSGKTKRAAR